MQLPMTSVFHLGAHEASESNGFTANIETRIEKDDAVSALFED
jgi:hypothetical protein